MTNRYNILDTPTGHGGIATQPVAAATAPLYVVFQAATGSYFAVDWLNGIQVATHATDAGSLLNTVFALMPFPSYPVTATVPSGGRILLAPGSYNVATSITMLAFGMALEGVSLVQGSVLKQNGALGSGKAVLEVGTSANTEAAHPQRVLVSRIHIIGGSGAGGERGINWFGNAGTMEDVVVQETSAEGIYVAGGTGGTPVLTYSNRFNRCSVINYGYSDATGASIDGFVFTSSVSDCLPTNCEAYQGTTAPARGRAGFRFDGAGGMIAVNCHAWNNQKQGALVTLNGQGTFIACQFESNGDNGMNLGTDDCSFISCNFYANGILDTDGASTHNSIYAAAAHQNRFIGCRFTKVRGETGLAVPNVGRHLYLDTNSHNNIISECLFADAGSSTANASDFIIIIGSSSNLITNNKFVLLHNLPNVPGRNPAHGVGLYGASYNNKITDNSFEMGSAATPAYYEEPSSNPLTGTNNQFLDNEIITGTVSLKASSLAIVQSTRERWGLVARGQIASAQVLTLFSIPQTLVAAPGAGYCVILDGLMLQKPAGTAYVGANGIKVRYTGAAGQEVAMMPTTGFTDQAGAQLRYVVPQSAAVTVNSSYIPVDNALLALAGVTADLTTGTSVLNWECRYHIVSSTPNVWAG